MRVALSAGTPAESSSPNVVVLQSVKTVTVQLANVRMQSLADALTEQTGQSFTVDPNLAYLPVRYDFLLRRVPVSQVKEVTAYLTDGQWVSSGRKQVLCPALPASIDLANRAYTAHLARALEYLSTLDASDPTLPPGVGPALQRFRTDMQPDAVFFPDDARAAMQNGTVAIGNGHIEFSCQDASGNQTRLDYGFRH
jgi:hypothetical protein